MSSPCGKIFLIDGWMQCFERTGGCNPLLFHQFFDFLCIRNLLYHLHAASQEPDHNLVWTEWLFACWPWDVCSCEIFCSMQWLMSLVLLTSVVGQLDGSCDDLCGPFHHSVDGENVEGSIPLKMISVGLDWDGMSPYCWRCVFLNDGDSVAYKCLPFVWWTPYPCQYNGRICLWIAFISCVVECH